MEPEPGDAQEFEPGVLARPLLSINPPRDVGVRPHRHKGGKVIQRVSAQA